MKTNDNTPKLELLAPAGDMEKLKTAVRFGADAVYFGGEMFSLRAGAGNFSVPEIEEAMEWLHANNAKGYMTINIYPHNGDISPLRDYISKIRHIPVDAFLVSDPGVMGLIKEQIPDAEIHLSTQANTTNYLTARFWASQGVKRIVSYVITGNIVLILVSRLVKVEPVSEFPVTGFAQLIKVLIVKNVILRVAEISVYGCPVCGYDSSNIVH